MQFLLRAIGVMSLAMLSTAATELSGFDEFKQGYYITKKDERKEGWIRYLIGNRSRAEYKETADARKVRSVTTMNCKEFGMEGGIRFVKVPKSVMIRVSGLNRVLSEEFVRLFEEGKINLYMFYTEVESKDIKDLRPVRLEMPIIAMGDGKLIPLSGNDSKTQQQLEEIFPRDPKAIKTLMSKNWDEILSFVQEYNKK